MAGDDTVPSYAVTNTYVYRQWIDDASTASIVLGTTCSDATSAVFRLWVQDASIANSTTASGANSIYMRWVAGADAVAASSSGYASLVQSPQQISETVAALTRLGRGIAEAALAELEVVDRVFRGVVKAARACEQQAAKERARTLLRSLLDERQVHTMEQEGFIPVYIEGSLPQKAKGVGTPRPLPEVREYRIRMNGRHGNIERVEDGRVVERLCVAPDDSTIPDEDAWAGQLLFLRAAERQLRDAANITWS